MFGCDEVGSFIFRRFPIAGCSIVSRFWPRRVLKKTIEQKLHAKIIARTAKENGCGFFREHRGVIPLVPGVFEHFEFFDRSVERRVIELTANGWIV